MGTAIYVYETEKEYLKIYHRMDKEVMFSAPILDIFLKPDKKLWVVSKVTKNKERPQLGRSIVNFVNEDAVMHTITSGSPYDGPSGDFSVVPNRQHFLI